MIGVDLFSGAGGMSIGALWAGIDVRLAIEADKYAAETYSKNHRSVDVQNTRIQTVRSVDLGPRTSPVVLFGGPPCQGFSTSNQRTRSADNQANWLFREYLRIVHQVSPEWIVFENVKGILETEGGMFIRQISTSLKRAGYNVAQWVLNAADYGVPQRRSRLFIVGCRAGRVPSPPPRSRRPSVTVWEAIGDLPLLRNGAAIDRLPYRRDPLSAYAQRLRGSNAQSANHLVTKNMPCILERYAHVPQGGNWSSIPKGLMSNYEDLERCHTGIYRRLRAHEPSVVIGNFRKNMLIHPTQNRGLSVREAARLQSFPDWFEFTGSIGFQQQQVGNAVPPLLAKAVFLAVRRAQQRA
ncbi:MAG: DNA cytosine methyltransferase [Acidobacteriaceae bacterium]|nr:DNA cytosine methyltransferase [Acidobacteriaceae bacterium]MBV9294224.1 DNA cytosine methyltransferase [Acidobacteriaceae bacterium]MBV9767374.1 DNA cytosine methyltransferase [Acidobacteriaceae bacterium]